MLRKTLVSTAILGLLASASPTLASGLATSFVVERGPDGSGAVVRGRVQDASGPGRGVQVRGVADGDDPAIVEIFFGMGPRIGDPVPGGAFVPAAGRAVPAAADLGDAAVTVSRGFRPGAAVCPPEPGGLDPLAEDLVLSPIPVRLR